MLAPPDDLPETEITAALRRGWGMTATSLAYRPVGWGSHHWDVTDAAGSRWFVTVDDLATRQLRAGEPVAPAFARLRASLAAAFGLRECGREFVVAPVPARHGEPLGPAAGRFAVTVYPLVDGESFHWGEEVPPGRRRAVLDMVIGVHTAPAAVAAAARADDFWIPMRDDLEAALDAAALDTAAGADPPAAAERGPYARRARQLVAAHAEPLRRQLARYDKLVAAAGEQAGRAVLTHGEPHPGNTMRTADGWRLIDWDTVLVAPPERDLWTLEPGDGSVLAAYAAATGVQERPDVLDLYRIGWDLADIALGVSHFRGPHGDTANEQKLWPGLRDLIGSLSQ